MTDYGGTGRKQFLSASAADAAERAVTPAGCIALALASLLGALVVAVVLLSLG